MIKSAIIFVLLVLVVGGAFLSRPTKPSFDAFARQQAQQGKDQNVVGRLIANWQIDSYLQSVTFVDRYLWVEVRQNGKLQFIGAFSKFFAVGHDDKSIPEPAKQETRRAQWDTSG